MFHWQAGFFGCCHTGVVGRGRQWWLTFWNNLPTANRILGLDQPDPQQIAHAVLVVSFGNKCLPFQNDKGTVLLRFFQHSKSISVFSRSVPSHNSVFGLWRKFFWPHGSIFTLTLSAVRLYMGRSVFLNHMKTHRRTSIKVINRKRRSPEFKCHSKVSADFQQCKTRKKNSKILYYRCHSWVLSMGYRHWDSSVCLTHSLTHTHT